MCGVMWVIVLLVDLTIVVSWGGGWNQETGFDLGMSLYWPWSWNYPNFDLSWHVLFAIPVKHFDYSQYRLYESNHAALTLTFIHCCGDLDMHSLQTFPHKSQHYYISKNSIIGLKLQLFPHIKNPIWLLWPWPWPKRPHISVKKTPIYPFSAYQIWF